MGFPNRLESSHILKEAVSLRGGGRKEYGSFNLDSFQSNFNRYRERYIPTPRYFNGASSQNIPSSSSCSDIMPSLPNILLLTAFSFALSEMLNFCGLFQDRPGRKGKQQSREFMSQFDSDSDFDTNADRLFESIEGWWYRQRHQRGGILQIKTWKRRFSAIWNVYQHLGFAGLLHHFSFKHQFAIGCSVGMIFHRLSMSLAMIGFYIYVGSEMLSNMQEFSRDEFGKNEMFPISRYHPDDDSKEDNIISNILEVSSCVLDRIRWAGRQGFQCLIQMLNDSDETFDNSVGTIIIGIIIGVGIKSLL
ncbi:predicted protein [Chaetoceros tenuissimus]|uniref:Uncharacterized protein n=1 Tax=Chaetoceros tenuissimus TaxID=426638 RepID=A0AAD3H0U0_9STRA|nr:predicted protein [Chaetoceros tenuissimus]